MSAAGREHVEMAIEEIEALPSEVRAAPEYVAMLQALRVARGWAECREARVVACAAGPLDVLAGPEAY